MYVTLYILISIITLVALVATIFVGREQKKPPVQKSQLNSYVKEYIQRADAYEKGTKNNMLKISIYYIFMGIICIFLLIYIPLMLK